MIAKVCDCESRRDSWFQNRLVFTSLGQAKSFPSYTHTFLYNPMQWQARGHSPWKVVWVCPAVKIPFSCLSHHSLGSQLQYHSVLRSPLWAKINVLAPAREISALQPKFGSNFSSQALKISKNFSSLDLMFAKKKKSSLAPISVLHAEHPHQTKKFSAPPPLGRHIVVYPQSNWGVPKLGICTHSFAGCMFHNRCISVNISHIDYNNQM